MITALLVGCGPYARWPDPESAFPWGVPPQPDLEAYEDVRWETETWDTTDPAMTGLYIQKSFFHRPSAHPDVLAHFDAMRQELPPLAEGLRLGFVGDVMLAADAVWAEYALPAAPLLDGHDLRVGNLETPTSRDHSTVPRALGTYAFNAPPEMLDGLPLDALQLNNNHSLDAGDLGLENTIDEVLARGLLPTGVDAQARATVDGQPIALLAYTWGMNDRRSSALHELYIVPFGRLDEPIPLDAIAADLQDARDDGALAVVLLHWGFEYEYYPDPHFLRLARQIVALGADLVVGHGPHVAQPAERCFVNHPDVVPGIGTCSVRTDDGEPRVAAVLYSLGNFGTDMLTVPTQVGLVASVSVDGRSVSGLGWQAVATVRDGDDRPWVEPLADHLDDPALADEHARLLEHLGERWAR